MKHTAIEPLEPRIAPAAITIVGKTATWTDFDGDIVTMKWTSADQPAFATMDKGAGLVVTSVTLDPAKHTGASFSIAVKAAGAFGDGRVELGSVSGSGVAIGKWNGPKAAISSLSLGVNDGVAAESFIMGSLGQSKGTGGFIRGTVGYLKINGDLGYGGLIMTDVADGKSHGAIIITGSLRGDLAGGNSADGFLNMSSASAASLTIGGSVVNAAIVQTPSFGNGPMMKSVTIGGDVVSTTDTSPQRVEIFTDKFTLGGSVIGARLHIRNDTVVKSVFIGGSLVAMDGMQASGTLNLSSSSSGVPGNVVGKVVVKGSLFGADFDSWSIGAGSGSGAGAILSNTGVGSITVGGSIHGGRIVNSDLAINGGIQAQGNIGKLSVGGGVYGYSNDPVFILASGNAPASGAFNAIGKLSIKRDAIHAYVSAGTAFVLAFPPVDTELSAINYNPNAGIGSVAIGGNYVHSNLFAGVKDGGSLGVNDMNIGDTLTAGGLGKLGPVVIKGHLLSEFDSPNYAGFAADSIAKITVNGRTVFNAGDGLRVFTDYMTAKEL
jgi:hypothetical protein